MYWTNAKRNAVKLKKVGCENLRAWEYWQLNDSKEKDTRKFSPTLQNKNWRKVNSQKFFREISFVWMDLDKESF